MLVNIPKPGRDKAHTLPVLPKGAGLGLRRTMLKELLSKLELQDNGLDEVSFFEVAPENWIGLGGRLGKHFKLLTERFQFTAHGLSLSLGGPNPLDIDFIKSVKSFLRTHSISVYTEHLSYCSDEGQLYDLIPIPFTEEAVKYVADRIRQVQDILECRIGIENVSYYAAPYQELAEIDFFNAVVSEADCGVLLDVNNIYVNSINHGYDPSTFLSQIPGDRVMYMHVAGHYNEADDLKVDTHGANVIDPVWSLLRQAYDAFGTHATLLERDFNIPPIAELLDEVGMIKSIQSDSMKHGMTAASNEALSSELNHELIG